MRDRTLPVTTTEPGLVVLNAIAGLAVTRRGAAEWTIRLPVGTPSDLAILSRHFVPAECDPQAEDQRMLGVDVAALGVDGKPIALDDARLAEGWYEIEGLEPGAVRHRWTDGAAILPAELVAGGRTLTLRVASLPDYPVREAAMGVKVAVG